MIKSGDVKFNLNTGKKITLKIHPNTKNGQKMKLRGMGNPCPTCDHNGDLVITVKFK
ncbi:MAG: DnaJ C-terminal domain-containing protein [Candidatus Omnitrophica bacterium]|nr:DnaJ C-terminal domain-containing protein [Candidatus Omnitrophota bacterium]